MGVPLDEDGCGGEGDVDARFGKALRETREKGVRVRAMIICNPQNPRGFTCKFPTILAQTQNVGIYRD